MIRHSLMVLLAMLAAFALGTPTLAETVTIRGEVTYRERIDLPPAAQLRIRLVDLTKDGAPATLEAAADIANPGRVPLTFTLNFDTTLIDNRHDYGLEADIVAAGELWFTTPAAYPIEPLATTTPIAILVNFAGRLSETPTVPEAEPEGPATPDILNTIWRAEAVNGEPIVPSADTSLSIAEDMRAGGRGGCNSYFAQARLEADRLAFSAIAATRMACTEDGVAALEAAYFAALDATRFWRLRDGKLLLLDAQGRELVQFGEGVP